MSDNLKLETRNLKPPSTHPAAEGAAGEAEQASAARAAAMLPAELLQPGEIIILLLKPSPWFILLAPLRTLAVLAVLTLGLIVLNTYYPFGVTRSDLTLVGVGLSSVRLFWQFLEWLSRAYILTDRRVITRGGVLRVVVFETRLKMIQHTSVFARVRERLFGLGTIGFATAGSHSFESFWVMIRQPYAVHRTIVETIRRYGK